jgi:hypothetical protein
MLTVFIHIHKFVGCATLNTQHNIITMEMFFFKWEITDFVGFFEEKIT